MWAYCKERITNTPGQFLWMALDPTTLMWEVVTLLCYQQRATAHKLIVKLYTVNSLSTDTCCILSPALIRQKTKYQNIRFQKTLAGHDIKLKPWLLFKSPEGLCCFNHWPYSVDLCEVVQMTEIGEVISSWKPWVCTSRSLKH